MIVHGHACGSVLQLAARLADVDIHLRWGGPQVHGAINGGVHLLNGLEQLQAFSTARVPHPHVLLPHETAAVNASIEMGSVLLGRRLEHTQGRDIRPSNTPATRHLRRWQDSDFYTTYVAARSEWRFHILRRRDGTLTSIGRGRKVWVRQDDAPTTGVIVRSRRLGWHLAHNIDPPKGLRSAAKAAAEACHYDLAAVDVLELQDGRACVLECNSRPALRDDYTLSAYERALRSY